MIFFKHKSKHFGQFMIVDCGSPRSLMGLGEYSKLMDVYATEKVEGKDERFKFGPSRIYESEFKIKCPMNVGKAGIFL